MNNEQNWMQRLEEFLDHVTATAKAQLHAVAIDLSGDPNAINAQITALAKHLQATTRMSTRV